MISTFNIQGTEYPIGASYDSDGNVIVDTYALQEEVNSQINNLKDQISTLQNIEDLVSYGIEYDSSVSSPQCTRIGNPLMHKSLPIQSQYQGCVVKDGVLQYWLDPNDWSKKAYRGVISSDSGVNAGNVGVTPDSGTQEASILDGTDGDVCVHIPKFYGKSGTSGSKFWVRISSQKIDDTWMEIPEMYVDAYRCTLHTVDGTTKTASVVNTTAEYRGGGNRSANDTYLETDKFKTDLGKPRTNLTRSVMRKYAANSGKELLCYEYYKWIFYWNYVIEYANFNSQANYVANLTSDGYHQGGLGAGVTTYNGSKWSSYNGYYPLIPCGYCNDIGNFTGLKTATLDGYTFSVPRWRGFDNPFGNIWTIIDGIVLKRDSANVDSNVYTTTDVSEFTDVIGSKQVAGIEKAQDGWITQFALGSRGDIIPSKVGGSSTTYMSDYHWCNASSTDLRLLRVGGGAYYGSNAGLGSFSSDSGIGLSNPYCGFRALRRI